METNETSIARILSMHAVGILIELIFFTWGVLEVVFNRDDATFGLTAIALVILIGLTAVSARVPLWADLLAIVALVAGISLWDAVHGTDAMSSWLMALGAVIAVISFTNLVWHVRCIRDDVRHRNDSSDQVSEA